MNSPQQTIGMNPISKIRAGLAVMLLLVLVGMLGFIVFEGMEPLDSLYMTVITISTVGFGEVSPLHAHGKILAIGLITTITFAIRAYTGQQPPIDILYGLIALFLLGWSLRPNLKKLMAGQERVVSISLNGWLRKRKEAKETDSNQ